MSYTKISNNDRRKTARRLRDAANCRNVQISPSALGRLIKAEDRSYRGILRTLADLIEPAKIDSGTSDGCHSFGELYHHRAVLFSVIVTMFPERAWKSRLHADGTMLEGMFIVGIETPDGQATYHYDAEPYWDMFPCEELDRAPEWDGHTPDQAIERIERLARRLTDARVGERAEIRSCWNVNDKDAGEAGKRGFKCSACGEVFKDGERYLTGGTWKYCPRCGGMVMRLI